MCIIISNLYYVLYESDSNLYALQSLHYQKSLDKKFLNTAESIEKFTKDKGELTTIDRADLSALIRENIL